MKGKLLNNMSRVILASTAGTSAMTLYSYIVSEIRNENFKEPLLLGDMIYTIVPDLQRKSAKKIGWIAHFCVGVFFAICYKAYINRKCINHPITKGLGIGTLTGIVAVIVWNSTFSIHPAPPRIKYKKFYGQLIISHAIFGLVTIIVLSYRRKRLKRSLII